MSDKNHTAEVKKLSDLKTQTRNANLHTERGMSALEESLTQDGPIGAVTVAADGETFDGSARIDKFADMGIEEVVIVHSDGTKPVVIVRDDIPTADDPRALRLGIAANRVAQLNLRWQTDELQVLKAEELISNSLFTTEEIQELQRAAYLEPEKPKEGQGGDSFEEKPDYSQTRVRPGDIWRIGNHRLACGDSRHATTYQGLMGHEFATLLATDPPYGVSYDRARGDYKKEIENDDLRGQALFEFLLSAFNAANLYLAPGSPLYIFHGDGPHGTRLQFERAFALVGKGIEADRNRDDQDTGESDWKLSATIIWAKNVAGYGFADYRAQHEPILYGWKQGEHYFTPDRTQTTLWEVNRDPSNQYVHPTQKPIALFERIINNSSRPRDIILDNFAGGGPLLIAAHRMGRVARLIDKDPAFCDVILRRAEAEGIEPIQRIYPLVSAAESEGDE